MKALIRNIYVDFSTVTHIESFENHILLHIFCGENIQINKNVSLIKNLEGVVEKYILTRDDYEKLREDESVVWEILDTKKGLVRVAPKKSLDKQEEDWQYEKANILDIWKNAESSIKDIKVYDKITI